MLTLHTKKLCVAACADAERQQGVLHLWVPDAATLCCTCSPADASTLMVCCYLVSVIASQSKLLTRCHMQSCSMVEHVVVNRRQQAVKRASSGQLSPLQNMAALCLQTEVKMNADGRGGECHLTCQTCPEFL